ncbi:acetoin utilization protein AcuC [Bacillus salitolerans]|uniref:Acetoin utilization protein AcuC n=1 Tax=Bacillus salitolerans TaxID=1437434 RepID=A0ABW4LVU7_9BACI
MSDQSVFIYSDKIENYRFNEHHPFNQVRVTLTKDLLLQSNLLQHTSIIKPRMATDEELALFHDRDYIQAVKDASKGKLSEDQAASYGIGTEDTPIFPNMHEASSLLVGGTLTAVDYVLEGKTTHALHLGGGLHHGFRGKASGFCIYNDTAVAIKYIQHKYNLKILYVDTDAHHGDGVQFAFYDDPKVCTFSIHETGRYLFPGTGNVYERGYGEGYGYSFNIPLDAFTEDESFIEAYETALNEIADFFKPDIIITQNGADAHHLDPLTHLSCSMKIYEAIPRLAHKIAHKYCMGKWIAVGGGGYDIWRVVPRAWGMVWTEMTEKSAIYQNPLPLEWIQNWQKKTKTPLPTTWFDDSQLMEPIPRRKEINEKNSITVQKALIPIRSSNAC